MTAPGGAAEDPDAQGEPVGWIREVVLDCADPWQLAAFWAAVVGGDPVQWYPGWVTLEPPPNGQRLSFQGVSGFVAPTWPAPSVPTQMHVDILVPDLQDAHDRVVGLGARFLAEHISPRPAPDGAEVAWRVYADPAGHPFCLVTR
jgi:predicted enzyme related to lactoylglutathione lyase